MKTIKSIFVLAAILFASAIFANNPEKVNETILRNKVISMISTASEYVSLTVPLDAVIEFRISEDDRLHVVKVHSESAFLTEFINSKLEGKKVYLTDLSKDRSYILKTTFVK